MVIQNICRESSASQTALFITPATLVIGGAYLTALGVISLLAGGQVIPACYAIFQSQTAIICSFAVGVVTMISSSAFIVIVACRLRKTPEHVAAEESVISVSRSQSEETPKIEKQKAIATNKACSYEESIIDIEGEQALHLSFSDKNLGCACVVSSKGERTSANYEALQTRIEGFFDAYCMRVQTKSFSSDASTGKFFQDQMKIMAGMFKTENPSKAKALKLKPNLDLPPLEGSNMPSMSFVQIETKDTATWVLTGQAGDTMIVIEQLNGTVSLTQKPTSFEMGNLKKTVVVKGFEFQNVKRVVGFTSGIGDFLSLQEITQILNETESSSELLAAFEERILVKGQRAADPSLDSKVLKRVVDESITGNTVKFFNPGPTNQVLCDIALFVLDVG